MYTPDTGICPDWKTRLGWTLGLASALCILFADVLLDLIARWSEEPQYFHGFFVPPVAAGIVYLRRQRIPIGSARTHLGGLCLIVVAVGLHIAGQYSYRDIANYAGLLSGIGGVFVLVWGGRFTLALLPAIGFLALMFPLPPGIENLLSMPLQLLGVPEAAWYIQMLGIPAYTVGSIIQLSDHQLDVANVFSGIRMFMMYLAISIAITLISRRTHWEKLLILFSAIPMAFACNIIRIVAAAVAWQCLSSDTTKSLVDDLSGALTIPAAIVLMYAELRLLDWLLLEVKDPLARVSASRHVPGIISVLSSADHSASSQPETSS